MMMKSFDMWTRDRRELLLDKDGCTTLGIRFRAVVGHRELLRDMQTQPKAAKAGGPASESRVDRLWPLACGGWSRPP